MNGKFLSLLLCSLVWRSSGKPTNAFLSYQDSLGQYSFGYSAPGSARSEIKTLDGATRGAYSYVDENGVIQSMEYVADDAGFHVIGTNLPQAPLPVEETAEVLTARKEHLEAYRLAQLMAEEAGNDQESSVLPKESVDQSERSENKNREGPKVTEKVVKLEEVSSKDNQVSTPKTEARPTEKSTWNVSDISILKDRLGLASVPVFRITHGEQQSEQSLAIEQDHRPTDQQNNEEPSTATETPSTMELQREESEFFPTVNLLLNTPYPALIRFAPPCAIHYVQYKN